MLVETRADAIEAAEAAPVSIQQIKRAVCAEFGVRKVELESPVRHERIVIPRMVGMALARRLTNLSLTQIGRHFGERHHWTVLYACRRMEPYIELAGRVMSARATPAHWAHAMQLAMEVPL